MPFCSPFSAPQSLLFTSTAGFSLLGTALIHCWTHRFSLNSRLPTATHIEHNLILNLLQNKPRPLPLLCPWNIAQLSCKFRQHFGAALVCPTRVATKSAFISICARHYPTLVFALFAPPLSMLCGCLRSARRGRERWGRCLVLLLLSICLDCKLQNANRNLNASFVIFSTDNFSSFFPTLSFPVSLSCTHMFVRLFVVCLFGGLQRFWVEFIFAARRVNREWCDRQRKSKAIRNLTDDENWICNCKKKELSAGERQRKRVRRDRANWRWNLHKRRQGWKVSN